MGGYLCKDCRRLEEDLEVVIAKHLAIMRKDIMDHITKEISIMKENSKSDDSNLGNQLPMSIPVLTRQVAINCLQ